MNNSLRSIHPEDIEFDRDVRTGRYQHTLFHVFPEFAKERGDTINVIYAGAVPGPAGINIYTVSDDKLQAFIKDMLKPETKLFFDDSHEGILFYTIMRKLHGVIGNFEDTGINGSQIYYFTATLNVADLYQKYCHDNNITNPINVISLNHWELSIKNGSPVKDRFNIIKNKEKLFLCFNRVFRIHRCALLGLLFDKDLVKDSYYSFFLNCYPGPDNPDGIIDIDEAMNWLRNYLSDPITDIVRNQMIKNYSMLPLKINIDSASNNKNYLDSDDMYFFDNSYFSLVTETDFFPFENNQPHATIFFSEKIYKPIIARHPFILVSSAHSLKYLRSMGYKTFSPFIDESYDDVEDHEKRLLAIVSEIERLSKFTSEEWIEWQTNVREIVDHNHRIISSRKNHEYRYSHP